MSVTLGIFNFASSQSSMVVCNVSDILSPIIVCWSYIMAVCVNVCVFYYAWCCMLLYWRRNYIVCTPHKIYTCSTTCQLFPYHGLFSDLVKPLGCIYEDFIIFVVSDIYFEHFYCQICRSGLVVAAALFRFVSLCCVNTQVIIRLLKCSSPTCSYCINSCKFKCQ